MVVTDTSIDETIGGRSFAADSAISRGFVARSEQGELLGGLARAHGGWVPNADAPAGGARGMVDWPREDLRPD